MTSSEVELSHKEISLSQQNSLSRRLKIAYHEGATATNNLKARTLSDLPLHLLPLKIVFSHFGEISSGTGGFALPSKGFPEPFFLGEAGSVHQLHLDHTK